MALSHVTRRTPEPGNRPAQWRPVVNAGNLRLRWGPTQQFTWKEIEAKFDKLAADHATEKLREKIKNAVRSPEAIQVSDLMEVLSAI